MNWAMKAAQEIQEHYPLSDELVASIIAKHAEPLIVMLRESEREHWLDDEGDLCDKVNYLDKQHACSCGADAWNARLEVVLR